MPELNIHLQIDPATGKKNLIIEYDSDSDALPHEHEEEHRALVNALVEGGLLEAEELGKVVVQRGQVVQIEDEREREREQAERGRESIEQGEG